MATPALFRVASIIGVVEVAARQWAVAKANKRRISQEVTDCRPAPEEQSGAERDDDYSREASVAGATL
jgi:hypothetical protein